VNACRCEFCSPCVCHPSIQSVSLARAGKLVRGGGKKVFIFILFYFIFNFSPIYFLSLDEKKYKEIRKEEDEGEDEEEAKEKKKRKRENRIKRFKVGDYHIIRLMSRVSKVESRSTYGPKAQGR